MNKNRCPKYRGQAILALAITLALLAPSRAAAPAALSQQSPPGQDRTSGPYIRLLGWEFDPLHDPEPLHLPSPLQAESYAAGQMNYYLMQFQGPVLPEWQDAVEEEGAVLLDYIPDFTFVVQMDAPTRDRVAQMPMVRWVGIYQAGYRLAPAVLAHAQETLNAPSEPLELRVSVFPGEDLGTVQNQVRAVGGQVLETSENDLGAILRVRADPAAVEALASVNGVRWIEPVPKWELHNSVSVDIMDVRDVWDTHNLYGAGQIVAVCDTGLDQGSTSPANLHDDFEDGSGNARVIALYDLDGDPASGPDDLDTAPTWPVRCWVTDTSPAARPRHTPTPPPPTPA
jgi:hypothetical protein